MVCSRILSASVTSSDLLALGRLGSVTGSAHAVLCAAAALWSREPSGWSEEPWADALQALQALQDPSLAVALDTPDIQADVLWTSRMSRSGWACLDCGCVSSAETTRHTCLGVSHCKPLEGSAWVGVQPAEAAGCWRTAIGAGGYMSGYFEVEILKNGCQIEVICPFFKCHLLVCITSI